MNSDKKLIYDSKSGVWVQKMIDKDTGKPYLYDPNTKMSRWIEENNTDVKIDKINREFHMGLQSQLSNYDLERKKEKERIEKLHFKNFNDIDPLNKNKKKQTKVNDSPSLILKQSDDLSNLFLQFDPILETKIEENKNNNIVEDLLGIDNTKLVSKKDEIKPEITLEKTENILERFDSVSSPSTTKSWKCPDCTFENSSLLPFCEMCQPSEEKKIRQECMKSIRNRTKSEPVKTSIPVSIQKSDSKKSLELENCFSDGFIDNGKESSSSSSSSYSMASSKSNFNDNFDFNEKIDVSFDIETEETESAKLPTEQVNKLNNTNNKSQLEEVVFIRVQSKKIFKKWSIRVASVKGHYLLLAKNGEDDSRLIDLRDKKIQLYKESNIPITSLINDVVSFPTILEIKSSMSSTILCASKPFFESLSKISQIK